MVEIEEICESDGTMKPLETQNYHDVGHNVEPTSRPIMVEPGAYDQTLGIHVGAFANFPETIVSLANEKVAELEDFSDGKLNKRNVLLYV